mmetsp:Transcript_23146/g.75464  ORF Transcript_23146/g.75464 Transcript_23146/m.75464 type:complete len:206 (+) Transcript_23146:78-695(+)|eukprot:CAMPEP_0170144228 /NCGR_PEP_ID=MMETSP0033_2-20121228/13369_1 /TAXON_ID=195969 /ORGANISM="Dolichomastix tenuilepis, Strain CCMP3274" /LENGTH=205 /DNA_ID=CAMNT_0010380717 /DNA_START=61 /DNA_END=678 /DNA_ORIENTATION=+
MAYNLVRPSMACATKHKMQSTAHSRQPGINTQSRRQVLQVLVGSGAGVALPSFAKLGAPQTCAAGVDGAACREATLAGDADRLSNQPQRAGSLSLSAQGNNTATDGYDALTLSLCDEMESFLVLDLYDPSRPQKIASLQKQTKAWVGRFAPGGSCKRASGRDMYNASNQLLGHFAFNGQAPLGRDLQALIKGNISKTRDLIGQGR